MPSLVFELVFVLIPKYLGYCIQKGAGVGSLFFCPHCSFATFSSFLKGVAVHTEAPGRGVAPELRECPPLCVCVPGDDDASRPDHCIVKVKICPLPRHNMKSESISYSIEIFYISIIKLS